MLVQQVRGAEVSTDSPSGGGVSGECMDGYLVSGYSQSVEYPSGEGADANLVTWSGSRASGYVPLARVRRRTPLSDE